MERIKTYNLNRIKKGMLSLTGKADHVLWKEAVVLTSFKAYWNKEILPKTEFRALWDGAYIYFCFSVIDSNVHIDRTDNTFRSIDVSDRVELFFRPDASLNPYYCLEMDPTSRVMDYKAYPNRKFDFNWEWPKSDLIVKSAITKTGFVVEGSISVHSLKKLQIIKTDGKIEAGLFRAKYIKVSDNGRQPIWIAWIDSKTLKPDFHVPSSFGILQLMQF